MLHNYVRYNAVVNQLQVLLGGVMCVFKYRD